MPPSVNQNISAGEDLLTAVRLYASGLGQLQSLDDGESDFYHLPLLALQQGLERWVKISLCFHHLEKHGEFPDESYFARSKQGHNIQPLLDQLVSLAYTTEFEVAFAYVKQDRVFLMSKPFRAYLISLSEFGVSSRYFHLNTVLGSGIPFNPPEHAWQDVEGKVLDYNPKLKEAFDASGGAQEVVLQVLAESRGILVRCGRALARLLVLGALGGEAKRYTGYVYKFLQLADEELITVKFNPFHKDV
jgi:hypothetical protein